MLKIGNAGKSDSATSLLNRSPLSCILRAKGKNLIRKKLEQTKIVLYDRTQTYDRINDLRWVGLRSCQSRKIIMTSPQIWLESWKRLQWINGLKMNRESIVTVCPLAFYTECILLPRLTVTKGSDSIRFLYSKRNALKYNTERKKICHLIHLSWYFQFKDFKMLDSFLKWKMKCYLSISLSLITVLINKISVSTDIQNHDVKWLLLCGESL